MSGQHSKQTAADGIHILQAYEYADAAARTGASGFVAGDVGKVAKQIDDDTYFILTATTPTWKEITPTITAHTIASHSDTSATGAELDTLTDGSNADSLHSHTSGDTRDFVTISTDTTITNATDRFIKVDTSGGDVTITLPDCTTATGTFDIFKSTTDNNKVFVVRAGSDTIHAETSVDWKTPYKHVEFVPDGGTLWLMK